MCEIYKKDNKKSNKVSNLLPGNKINTDHIFLRFFLSVLYRQEMRKTGEKGKEYFSSQGRITSLTLIFHQELWIGHG